MGEEKIALGSTVVDTVTKVQGTLTARIEYLHMSTRCEITVVDKSTGMPKEFWVNESQLAIE
jgi:hypothetical protein